MTIGDRGGEPIVMVLLRTESGVALRAWSLSTQRLMLDQQLLIDGELSLLYLHGDDVVALAFTDGHSDVAGESQPVHWSFAELTPRPEPLELRRIDPFNESHEDSENRSTDDSEWSSEDELPELEGRIRRVPGGPQHLIFTSVSWEGPAVVDLERGTVEQFHNIDPSSIATMTMIGGRPTALEASNGWIHIAGDLVPKLSTRPGEVSVLMATAEAELVVAGCDDGTVHVWRHLSVEPDIFPLRSPVRALEIIGNEIILVLCNRGLVALRADARAIALTP